MKLELACCICNMASPEGLNSSNLYICSFILGANFPDNDVVSRPSSPKNFARYAITMFEPK